MKEVFNKNVDIESKTNKEKLSVTLLKTFSKMLQIIFERKENEILKIFQEQIDINTILNKFDTLMRIVAGNIDILLIAEST